MVIAMGIVVTGSGPHAGDLAAPRFGFEIRTVAWLHADLVIAFIGLLLAYALLLHFAPVLPDERYLRARKSESKKLIAITLAQGQAMIGSIGLDIVESHKHARLSYWLGVPYWNRGYCTEAVAAVLGYGFRQLELNRIYSPHFLGNDASGRVLQKAGMTYEGRMREHYLRFDRFVDLELYGMLRRDFIQRNTESKSGTTPG